MKKNQKITTGLEAMALFTQLGLTMAIPIAFGVLAGHWLDRKLGTGVLLMLILTGLGIVAGFIGAYQQITQVAPMKKKKSDGQDKGKNG